MIDPERNIQGISQRLTRMLSLKEIKNVKIHEKTRSQWPGVHSLKGRPIQFNLIEVGLRSKCFLLREAGNLLLGAVMWCTRDPKAQRSIIFLHVTSRTSQTIAIHSCAYTME